MSSLFKNIGAVRTAIVTRSRSAAAATANLTASFRGQSERKVTKGRVADGRVSQSARRIGSPPRQRRLDKSTWGRSDREISSSAEEHDDDRSGQTVAMEVQKAMLENHIASEVARRLRDAETLAEMRAYIQTEDARRAKEIAEAARLEQSRQVEVQRVDSERKQLVQQHQESLKRAADAEAQCKAAEAALAQAKDRMQQELQKVKEAQEALEAEAAARRQEAEAEVKMLKRRIEEVIGKNSELENKRRRLEADGDLQKREAQKLKSTVAALQGRELLLKRKWEVIEEERDEQRLKKRKLEASIEDFESTIARLEKENADLATTVNNQANEADAVVNAKHRGLVLATDPEMARGIALAGNELLGLGSSSAVMACVVDGKKMAAKLFGHDNFHSAGDLEAGSKMFDEEYHLLSTLKHNNIVQVHKLVKPDASGDQYNRAILMELLDEDAFKHYDQFTSASLFVLMKDISSALSYLHKRKMCHGDVKEANIAWNAVEGKAHGCFKLLDFGQATREGEERTGGGTLFYNAPEAAKTDIARAKSDIYSLFVTAVLINREYCQEPAINAFLTGTIGDAPESVDLFEKEIQRHALSDGMADWSDMAALEAKDRPWATIIWERCRLLEELGPEYRLIKPMDRDARNRALAAMLNENSDQAMTWRRLEKYHSPLFKQCQYLRAAGVKRHMEDILEDIMEDSEDVEDVEDVMK